MKKKESLVLYYDLLDSFRYMTKEQIADFILAIFEYEIEGKAPEFEDRLLYSLFVPIAKGLDINKEKYERVCEKNRENIKTRWKKPKSEEENIPDCTSVYEPIPPYTKNTDNDNDIDIDNDNDIVIDKDVDNEKDSEADSLLHSSISEHTHKNNNYYGTFSNVFLTDEQYRRIREMFPDDYGSRIDSMSAYMKSSGKSYADCFARLSTWKVLDREKKRSGKPPQSSNASYDIDAYMKQSLNLVYKPREDTS